MSVMRERSNRPDAVARLFALEQFGIKLGLDNIRALVAALDSPQQAYPSVHIAGTNGKGSVSAMVERGLRAAGYRTGRYTSPHLDRIEERIAIDGEPIDGETFARVAEDVLDLVDRLRRDRRLETTPTFFEVTTAMAFETFRRARADVAVVEVGLGGRCDATNVITPAVAAITSIALDHERHLGNTLAGIAREKAGILKPGVPAAIGEMPASARRAIEEVAEVEGARLVVADRSLVSESTLARGRATISVDTPARSYWNVRLGLNGPHQVANAVVAIRVLELFEQSAIIVKPEAVISGLSEVEWPGRLEWVEIAPGKRLLIDAAHNPAGAHALSDYLGASGDGPLPVALGVMKDKDVEGMVRALLPVASRFVVTSVAGERALAGEDLAFRIRRIDGTRRVDIARDGEAAVATALQDAPAAVVAGSIFLIGPLRARLIAAGAVSLRH
jgi:dihydrofolate synthase/folylpolyglutamate synthase